MFDDARNPARAETSGYEGEGDGYSAPAHGSTPEPEQPAATSAPAPRRATHPDATVTSTEGRDAHPHATPEALMPTAPGPDAHPGLPASELDRIVIERMHVRGYHGVFEHERRDGQDFFIDAEVWLDTRASAASDDIDDTVHYGLLMRALYDVVAGEPVDLLETLAERLAAVTLAFRGPQAVRITVHKPKAPVNLRFEDVAVSVLRFRPDASGGAQ